MELYITDLGTVVKKRDDLFEITTSEKKVAVVPQKIKSLVLSKGIFLTTDVIKLAVDNNIDIVIVVQQLILEENSWKYLGLKRELNWQNRY